jgi:hypothetical protein
LRCLRSIRRKHHGRAAQERLLQKGAPFHRFLAISLRDTMYSVQEKCNDAAASLLNHHKCDGADQRIPNSRRSGRRFVPLSLTACSFEVAAMEEQEVSSGPESCSHGERRLSRKDSRRARYLRYASFF